MPYSRRVALVADLGMSPVELLQSDGLLVVEGDTDRRRLEALFPVEMGRIAVHTAGSAAGVLSAERMLYEGDFPVPWLCVRDRDLLPDADVATLIRQHPGVFVWAERELENVLLDCDLVAASLARGGRATSADEVRQRMRNLAEDHRQAVCAELTEYRLSTLYAPDPKRSTDVIGRKKAQLEALAEAATARIDAFDRVAEEVRSDVDARWEDEWHRLMDGKRMLGQFRKYTPFQSKEDFLSALMTTAAARDGFMPEALVALKERVRATLASSS